MERRGGLRVVESRKDDYREKLCMVGCTCSFPREICQTKIFHSCISGAHGAGIATLSPRGLNRVYR